jgi:uncharacterized protein
VTGVVVIQGGGPGAHDADRALVESLRRHLGAGFEVDFPRMPDEGDPDPERWSGPIRDAIARAVPPRVLVGHSIGGYLLLKQLVSEPVAGPIAAICVIAAPFPGGDPDWTFEGFELPDGFADRLPPGAAVLLYASEDDEVVPFAHRDLYAARIPGAVVRTTTGGHQLGGDLAVVARDIRAVLA